MAREQRLTEASEELARASRLYREATLFALREGPLTRAARDLEQVIGALDETDLQRAQQRLAEIRGLL